MAQIQTKIILRNDELSAWEGSKVILDKGEIALAKREDGSYDIRIGNNDKEWKDLSGSFAISSDQVIGLDKELEKIHVPQVYTELSVDTTKGLDVIISESAALSAQVFGPGDMLVLKDAKSVASAYQYDKEEGWIACDGNVDASKVILDSNITITQAFGKHNINSTLGYGQIPCAGWNMKQLISESFSNTQSAGQTKPSISWSTQPSDYGTVEAGTWVTGGNAAKAIQFYYTDGSWKNYNSGKTSGNRVQKQKITISRTASQAEDFDGNIFNLSAINKSYTYNSETDALSVLQPGSSNKLTLIGSIPDADLSVQATDSAIELYKWTATVPYEAGTVVPVNNIGTNDEGNKIPAGTMTGSGTIDLPKGSRYCFWAALKNGYEYDITTDADGKYVSCNITSDQIRAFMNLDSSKGVGNKNVNMLSGTKGTSNFTIPEGTKQIIFAAPTNTWKKKIAVYNESNLGAGLDFQNENKRATGVLSVNGANGYTAKSYDMWFLTFGSPAGGSSNLTITWKDE